MSFNDCRTDKKIIIGWGMVFCFEFILALYLPSPLMWAIVGYSAGMFFANSMIYSSNRMSEDLINLYSDINKRLRIHIKDIEKKSSKKGAKK